MEKRLTYSEKRRLESRRNFIKNCLARAGMAAGSGTLFYACSASKIFENWFKEQDEEPKQNSSEIFSGAIYSNEDRTTNEEGLVNLVLDKSNNIRQKIKEGADKESGCFLFGNYLDELEKRAKQNIRNGSYNFEFKISDNFFVSEMDFLIEIIKNKFEVNIYQNFNSEKVLLMKRKVCLGRNKKGRFSTPTGKYFLKRIIENPWWYPPKWADQKDPSKPGKNNPYGLWMSELSRDNSSGNYNWGVKRDSGIRIHSTNNSRSIGRASSHGCIRLHPEVAKELFPAILHYSKHKKPKTNSRGTIYPLQKAIPLVIK